MSKRPARHALALIQAEPWAITREGLAQIIEVASRENRSLEAIEAARGQPLDNTYKATVREGIATIRLSGPLFRYANLFTAVSGATSLELIAKDFTAALADPSVRAILLAIDSPGGTVSGTSELADLIYQARGVKPVHAHIDGFGASGAYWLGSAADRVTASDTSLVGSIGVVMTEQLEDDPEIIEFVSSQSPKKRTNPAEELGRAERQAIVDALADRFLEAVSRHRGVESERVLAEFGQGGVFVGAAAEEAGLIDEVSTYEQVHAALVEETSAARMVGSLPWGASASRGLPAATRRDAAAQTQEPAMTTKAKQSTAPAAADEDETDEERKKREEKEKEQGTAKSIAARHPEAAAELRAEGATAERARILAIEELAIPGADAVIKAAKADPTCTAEKAALQLVQAQRAGTLTVTAPAPESPGKKHLAALAGDETKINAPKDQPSGAAGGEVATTVQSLVAFSSLRRAPAAAN